MNLTTAPRLRYILGTSALALLVAVCCTAISTPVEVIAVGSISVVLLALGHGAV